MAAEGKIRNTEAVDANDSWWQWVDFDAMSVTQLTAPPNLLLHLPDTSACGDVDEREAGGMVDWSPAADSDPGDEANSPESRRRRAPRSAAARKDAEKRKQQNRSAQRAYRDRQKVLVEGLMSRVQELSAQAKQQNAKCELLETMCRRLKTENEVYREFLKGAASGRKS